jgi:beta-mannosidase
MPTSLNLNGKWKVLAQPMSAKGETGLRKMKQTRGGWLEARVPGEIHLDLKRAGKMPEPLESTHAPKCRWPEKKSWWYRTSLNASPKLLAHERVELIFDGLDLYAQVFLNGKLVGEAKNAFVPAVFDAKPYLKRGRNDLVVRLTVGTELSGQETKPVNYTSADPYKNRYFLAMGQLRKAQFSYGWDWVDSLPNIGIWRGVRIEGRSGVVLHDLRLDTAFHGRDVYLEMDAVLENLHPWSERTCVLELTITPPRGKRIRRRYTVDAQVGRSTVCDWMEIPEAQLWWPNGMGDQPLYHVTACVIHEGAASDSRELDIGLRTVDIDRSRIPSGGSRFCVRVNGEDVFCKGGNWIPCDAIMARADTRRYQALISEAAYANVNMLRIWGGGIYEDDAFYDACNRSGILIWQDFMYACSEYPDDRQTFRDVARSETEAIIMRLRHHPCIAMWCGNNENNELFAYWNRNKIFGKEKMQIGGMRLYNQVLPDACRSLDPNRPYWPSSPLGGDRPTDEEAGDTHWWHEATMHPDMNRRIRDEVYDECKSRFVSEYGVIGPCHLETMKQCLEPEEMNRDSLGWRVHTNTFEKVTLPAAIRLHYAEPEDLDMREYTLYGQMFQASQYGRSIEALRFRKHDVKDDCQGALIWMYNDCWAETGWTIIDYYLRRKPSYYAFKRACRPVRIIVRRRGRFAVTRIVNDSREKLSGRVSLGWARVDGASSSVRSMSVRIPANGMIEVERERIPPASTQAPEDWIYVAHLEGKGFEPDDNMLALVPHRELRLPRPTLEVADAGDCIVLWSDSYCHGVHVPDAGKKTLSDNYFDLLPGIPKTVRRTDGRSKRSLRFRTL